MKKSHLDATKNVDNVMIYYIIIADIIDFICIYIYIFTE